MEIQKVKYSSKNGQVAVDYIDSYNNEYSVKLWINPHPDFVQALNGLTQHMIDICEISGDHDHRFKVTGISLGGDAEFTGVVIIGQKEVLNKKVFNIVTPFVMFQEDKSDYEDAYGLNKDVGFLVRETIELIGGKSAQAEIDFEEAEKEQEPALQLQ